MAIKLHPALLYKLGGIGIVEALAWCVLLPWMHHQYTTGIALWASFQPSEEPARFRLSAQLGRPFGLFCHLGDRLVGAIDGEAAT